MPNDFSGLLTKKIGPLPGYAWAIGVGALAYFVIPKLTAGSSGAATTATTGAAGPTAADQSSGFVSGYQQGYSQGATYTPSGTAASAASGAAQQFATLIGYKGASSANLFSAPGSSTPAANVPAGTSVQITGSAVPVTYPSNPDLTSMTPVLYQGKQLWAFTPEVSTGSSGTGGAGRSQSVGNRSADPHAYFHPSMKQVPDFPHFTRAGTGGAGHQQAVHQIAHQTGLHPARLAILNPRPHRFIRVA